jgi:membrane protein DedA with SNARE-associated domain
VFFNVPVGLGLPTLAALVFGESAGLPLPGETALITAGALAASGSLTLPAVAVVVVVVAVAAAIAGDTLGFWLGRRHGRALLERNGFLASSRRRALPRADRFFARHGSATIFAGRFVPGVRVVAAVLAGATHVPWRRFAFWNALGALTWATTVGGIALVLGPMGAMTFAVAGLGLAALAAVVRPLANRLLARRYRTVPHGSQGAVTSAKVSATQSA